MIGVRSSVCSALEYELQQCWSAKSPRRTGSCTPESRPACRLSQRRRVVGKAVTASLLAVSVASLAPHSVACWWPGDALKKFFGGSDGTTVPPDTVAPYESNDVLYNTTFASTDNMMTMPQTQETMGFSLEHLMTTSDTDAVPSGTRPPDHENLGMATMVSSEATAEATETTAQLTIKNFVTTSSTPLYDPNENSVSAFNSQLLGNSTSDSVAQATAVTSESTVLTTSERAVTDTSVPSTTLMFPSGSAHNHTSTLANKVQFDATASLSTVDQPVTIPYVDDDTSALPNELGPDATGSVTVVGPLTTAAYVNDVTLTLANGATTNMDVMVPSAAATTDDSETFSTLFTLAISGNVLVDQGKAEDASNLVAPVDNSATRTTLVATNGADSPQSGSRPFDDDAISSVTALNAEATPEATETTAQFTTESFATTFSTPPFDLDENSVLAFNSGMFGSNMSVTVPDHSPPTATSEALGSATFSQTSGEVLQSTTEGNIVATVDQLDHTTETTMLTTSNMTVNVLLHAIVTGAGLEDTAVGSISNNASTSTVGVSSVTEHMTNSSTIATPTTEPKTEASQLMSSSGPMATTVTMIRFAAGAPEETGHMTFSSAPMVSAVPTASVAVKETEETGKVAFSSTPTATPATMSSTAAEGTKEIIQVAFSSTTMATPATISSTTTEAADETGNNMSSSTPMASTVVMSSTAVEETEETVQVTFGSTPLATPATISSTAAEHTKETSQVTLSSTSTATSATTSSTAADATNETGNATSSSTAIAINVTMPSTASEWTEETVEVTFPNTLMVTSSSTAVEGIEETSQVMLSTTPTATNATMSFITAEVAEETGNGTSLSRPVASTVTMPSTVAEETEETVQDTFSSTPMTTSATRNSTTAGDTGETGHVTSSSAQTATVTMRHNAAQSSMESTTQFNNASPSEDEAHHEASSTEDLASIGYSLTSQSTVPELQHNDAEDTKATTTTAVTRRYKPVYVRRFTPWLISRSTSSLPVTSSSSPTSSYVRSQPELDTPNAKEASTVESEPNTVQERLYQNNLSLRSLPATSNAITKVPPSDTLVVPQSFFGSRNALFNRFGRPYCPGCDALLIKLPPRFSVPRVPPYIYG
ncbi:hypothetical protein MRX96_054926 [Rhipicephalus microplus]